MTLFVNRAAVAAVDGLHACPQQTLASQQVDISQKLIAVRRKRRRGFGVFRDKGSAHLRPDLKLLRADRRPQPGADLARRGAERRHGLLQHAMA